jgi:hypothetical protein
VFSPDGSKYAIHDIRFDPFSAIDIYDFDRCDGQLTHLEHFELDDTTGLSGGVAISPDSRYLYVITRLNIYQYDLQASDIQATQTVVASYDGYIAYWFDSAFNAGQLAPDGKIYLASSSSDTVMHVIQSPNQPGLACHVTQHSLALPTLNEKSVPNLPFFRLGPLDDSPCDTLGLDNRPVAQFTWYANGLAVAFSDNSYYRPENWHWDFGDGTTDNGRNPLHEYAAPGDYYVCLTVWNEFDSSTYCRWVAVDTLAVSAWQQDLPEAGVLVFPNPASEAVQVAFAQPPGQAGEWVLYDALGQPVRREKLLPGQRAYTFSLPGLPEGLYFWSLSAAGARVQTGKLIVAR